jgi:poly(3-hydroxybutyrate) depolymerase
MLYQLYETQESLMAPWRAGAGLARMALGALPRKLAATMPVRYHVAVCEMMMHTRLTHTRPDFGIDQVAAGGQSLPVVEEVTLSTPFGRLVHFRKAGRREEPRVLIVAALSGHFATLMRDTVRTMLADHDVYLAEWENARDVAAEAGRFGLDEYIEHVIRFLDETGPGTHVVAVCQPCPAVVAAAAVMAGHNDPAQPRTLTLMAGPMDTTSNPTAVNELAWSTPLAWFEENVVMPVPAGYPGFGRKVYPGFLQLSAFVSMNLERHLDQHALLFRSLVRGDDGTAASVRTFYDEYFAVLDIDADFYLQTIDAFFQRNLLVKGELHWKGELVDPGAIRSTALLTVEGERDDVCGLGQTMAAHDLLNGVKASSKSHHLQVGVGHYGVFSGRRWQQETYPVVRDFILMNA